MVNPLDADPKIAGPSTIEFQVFSAALGHRGSPAFPEALSLWKVCRAWSVDPNVALAFFWYESNCGTAQDWYGRIHDTRNWGNLREGPGAYQNDGNFAYYATYAISLNDFCALLRGPLYAGRGLLTVAQVVPVYAPAKDHNDTQRYISEVTAQMRIWNRV